MAFLFSSGNKSNAASAPNYTGMQLQSSAYGVAVPVVYGCNRVSWNLLDYVNFQQINTPTATGGGKGGVVGGGGKGGNSNTVSYTASILGSLCEGPITGVFSSWVSQTQSAGYPNFSIFTGAFAQSAWSYLSTNYATHALTYSGIAYMAASNYDLGSSANLPNINWEVQGFLYNSAPGTYGGNGCNIGGDADPSQVVLDILTNTRYGLSFPASRVGQVNFWNESHLIPGSPFQVTVTHAAQYAYGVSVTIGTTLLVCVASSPALNQYSFNPATGVYTFNTSNSGQTAAINYVSISAMTNYQNFTLASGLWISPAYTSQTQGTQVLDDIAKATYSEVIFSSGVFQMVPRGTLAITANGYTFTPSTTPLFSLGINDLMDGSSGSGGAGNDPVTVTRQRKADQLNSIRYEVLDRANQYATAIVEILDQAQIDKYGRRAGASQQFHMFCDLAAANVSVNLQLQDQYISNQYTFDLDGRYIVLDPMDLVEITDPNFSALTNIAIRLLDIQENDDGTITVTAEEYPATIGTVPAYNLNSGAGLIQDYGVNPGNALAPAIFDVPVELADVIGLETWIATCSATANPNWGGCDVYISSDNTNFFKQGTLVGASRMGVLTSNYNSSSDPDTTHTLAVDLTNSFGTLQSGSTGDADHGVTLCFVDGEYISYSTATLSSTYHYNLTTYLRRGQFGSSNSNHLSGTFFVRLDNQIFAMPYTKTDVGKQFWVKLISFNIFGAGHQSIASVSSYSHTIGGPPVIYAPSGLTASAAIKGIQLNWTNAPNVGQAGIEVWRSASSAFGSASLIGTAADYSTSYTDQAVGSATAYWYWIRAFDIAGNETAYTPSTGGAGATVTAGQAASGDIGLNAVIPSKIDIGSSDNLILDGLTIDPANWTCSASISLGSGLSGTAWINDTYFLISPTVASGTGLLSDPIACKPGDSFYMAANMGESSGTISNSYYLYAHLTDGNGSFVSDTLVSSNSGVGGPHPVGGYFTVPGASNPGFIQLYAIWVPASNDNGTFNCPVVRRMTDSNLLLSNNVNTFHMVSGSITGSTIGTGSGTLIGASSWTTVASITMTISSATSNVLFQFSDYWTWSSNGPRGFYRILRDGTTTVMTVGLGGGSCPDFLIAAGAGLDNGLSGSHTWALQAEYVAGNQPTSQQAIIIGTELKK